MNECKPHSDFARRSSARRQITSFLINPACVRLSGPLAVVGASKQRHVLAAQANIQEQFSQVLLSGDGLREYDRFAAASTLATELQDDSNRVLK
jgi:hypothetical protein